MVVIDITALNLGIVLLLVPVIAEYIKIRETASSGFNIITISGLLFVFSAIFHLEVYRNWLILGAIANLIAIIAGFVAVIGILFTVYKFFK
jgi:hypothetical protein